MIASLKFGVSNKVAIYVHAIVASMVMAILVMTSMSAMTKTLAKPIPYASTHLDHSFVGVIKVSS